MERFARGAAYFAKTEYPFYRDLYTQLARGQRPDALVITCSDSRIVLSKLFGTNAGDLFVLRTAGLMVPEYGTILGGEQATIEYAIKRLGVKDVILLGHTNCGVVEALLNPPPDLAKEMPALASMMETSGAKPKKRLRAPCVHVDGEAPGKGRESRSDKLSRLHLLRQMETLGRYPFIKGNEKVQLHGCLFDIRRGLILRYEAENGSFKALY